MSGLEGDLLAVASADGGKISISRMEKGRALELSLLLLLMASQAQFLLLADRLGTLQFAL